MIAQGISHTAYDTMKEYMLTGAELDGKYQIPMMDRYVDEIPQDTVDFKDSFSRKIKNHRELSINFYIHDCEFEKLWNNQRSWIIQHIIYYFMNNYKISENLISAFEAEYETTPAYMHNRKPENR